MLMDDADRTTLDVLREIGQVEGPASGMIVEAITAFQEMAADDFDPAAIAESWVRDARKH
jgi:hypothetical protein